MEPTPLTDAVLDALTSVLDPEVGLDIVNLGLVYDVEVEADAIRVAMTMTTAACPVAPWLVDTAKRTIERRVADGREVTVDLVWEPAWTPDRMSAAARRELGWT